MSSLESTSDDEWCLVNSSIAKEDMHTSTTTTEETQPSIKGIIDIKIESAGYDVGCYASIHVGKVLSTERSNRGLNVVVLADDGSVVSSLVFDTHSSSRNSAEFVNVVKSLKDGTLVLIAINDEATSHLTDAAKSAIKQLGSSKIDEVEYRHSWCLIGRKGASNGALAETHNPRGVAVCSQQVNL